MNGAEAVMTGSSATRLSGSSATKIGSSGETNETAIEVCNSVRSLNEVKT